MSSDIPAEALESATVALDANVLRSGALSSAKLRRVLLGLGDRLLITNHVKGEFLSQSGESTQKAIDKVTLGAVRDNARKVIERLPASAEEINRLETWLDRATGELEELVGSWKARSDDPDRELEAILAQASMIELTAVETLEAASDALVRQNSRFLQPGKANADKQENRIGDIIIWHELIKHARRTDRDVILVTSDRDFFQGAIAGEGVDQFLAKEFNERTQRTIWALIPDQLTDLLPPEEDVPESELTIHGIVAGYHGGLMRAISVAGSGFSMHCTDPDYPYGGMAEMPGVLPTGRRISVAHTFPINSITQGLGSLAAGCKSTSLFTGSVRIDGEGEIPEGVANQDEGHFTVQDVRIVGGVTGYGDIDRDEVVVPALSFEGSIQAVVHTKRVTRETDGEAVTVIAKIEYM